MSDKLTFSHTLFNYVTNFTLGWAVQDHSGVQIEASILAFNLADGIVLMLTVSCSWQKAITPLRSECESAPQRSSGVQHAPLMSSIKISCSMVNLWRKLTNPSISAQRLATTVMPTTIDLAYSAVSCWNSFLWSPHKISLRRTGWLFLSSSMAAIHSQSQLFIG